MVYLGDNRLLFFAQPTYGLGIYGLQNQTYTFQYKWCDVATNGFGAAHAF